MTKSPASDADVIDRLYEVIESRRTSDPAASYTARMFDKGLNKIAQKVGEEGVETALALVSGDRAALRGEAADLLYHLVVALRGAGASIGEALAELDVRAQAAR